MRRWIRLLMMSCLIIGASSCARPPARVAPPPLPERPVLASMVRDKNDATGEVGAWLSFGDVRQLTRWAESIEAVRDLWK